MPVTIEIKGNNITGGYSQCAFCGGEFADREAWTAVTINGQTVELCFDCLSAGPETTALRTEQYADGLREQADILDCVAEAVRGVSLEDWPTVADFERVCEEQVAAQRAEKTAWEDSDNMDAPAPDWRTGKGGD